MEHFIPDKTRLIVLLDGEGYPTEEYLQWIRDFSVTNSNVWDLIDVVLDTWHLGDYGYVIKRPYRGKRTLKLHTLGWSGNEDIISALRANVIFFAAFWKKSETGGHYTFRIPKGL